MDDAALESAFRALRHRDRSAQEVERRLAEQGFSDDERLEALATLTRTGVVDDVRFAEARARALAGRGAGDERIRFELARAGVEEDVVEGALEGLESELDRARRILARRGAGPKTIRYLHAHGFARDVIAAVAALDEDELR